MLFYLASRSVAWKQQQKALPQRLKPRLALEIFGTAESRVLREGFSQA
jgi:hypothetical protein